MNCHGRAFAVTVLTCMIIGRLAGAAGPSTQPLKIDCDPGEGHEYCGDIGGNVSIGMTLRISKDHKTATGSYFYYKYARDIRIDASIEGRAITIREFDGDGNQTGQFVGEFPTTDPRGHYSTDDLQVDVIVGKWSRPDGSKSQPFYLNEDYIESWPEGTSRYAGAGFDDEAAVDQFVARFRQAVSDSDVQMVTGMVQFPIRVTIEGKRKTINNPDAFRRYYAKIFQPYYVDRIRGSPTCHMFSNGQGVMLGNGEIWVAPVKRAGKEVPVVIAINNDMGSRRK